MTGPAPSPNPAPPRPAARPAAPLAPQIRLACLAADLALLILYPVAWAAPLARAGLLPFFSGTELSILSGLRDLWATDVILAMVVGLFAVVAPYFKVIVLTVMHARGRLPRSGDRWMSGLEIAGKLSMADIFLLALYIVVAKGVGVGYVTTAWGLYLFTALVLGSLLLTMATKRLMRAGTAS